MKVVVALGGNALLKRGEPPSAQAQRRNVASAADAVASIARAHAVVVTHGNGPQVGLLALQAEESARVPPFPLDVLDAETEGMIGYLIEQELASRLPDRRIATLLTQIQVDADDPAFSKPDKPIGLTYTAEQAKRLAQARGWSIAPDGDVWRRVVPSPEPRRVLELATIRLLVDAGVIVICAGGGGIPVVVTQGGGIRGVEAVIDKDLAAALLARAIKANALLMLTDVDAVYLEWNTPAARALRETTPRELRRHPFAAGTMGPKVEAACRFVEATRGVAGIGRLDDAMQILDGRCGTTVRAG
ncbi:MAG: carbamate kinase [Betaproteobacteria bacterium SG8_41]|nr:MAG: carbamate kinase [Betaproteobacteria bacterium SG8_41]